MFLLICILVSVLVILMGYIKLNCMKIRQYCIWIFFLIVFLYIIITLSNVFF